MRAGDPQDRGKQRLHIWRAHTRFHVQWDPGQSNDSIGAWIRTIFRSFRVSWEGKGLLHSLQDTAGGHPRGNSLASALLEVVVLTQRPSPTQQPTGSSARMPQSNPSIEQEHSPTHQQTQCLKSSRAHSCLQTHPLPTVNVSHKF